MRLFEATAHVEGDQIVADVEELGAHTFAPSSDVMLLKERVIEAVLAATDDESDVVVLIDFAGETLRARHLGLVA